MVAKEFKDRSHDLNAVERINEIISLYDVLDRKILYISPSVPIFWGMDIEEIMKNPSIYKGKIVSRGC